MVAVRSRRSYVTGDTCPSPRSYGVDVPFMSFYVHEWDIHALWPGTGGSRVMGEPIVGRAAGQPASRPAGWWRAWRDRFGLAEVCGTLAAVAGFAAGYAQAGSLLAAAALATIGEAIGFYGCIGAKTVASGRRATVHLGGWRRLAAGAWHAVREQLASCAVAETVDGFLIRPGCLAGAAWLLRPLPGRPRTPRTPRTPRRPRGPRGSRGTDLPVRGRICGIVPPGTSRAPAPGGPPHTWRSIRPARPSASASWPPRCRTW